MVFLLIFEGRYAFSISLPIDLLMIKEMSDKREIKKINGLFLIIIKGYSLHTSVKISTVVDGDTLPFLLYSVHSIRCQKVIVTESISFSL